MASLNQILAWCNWFKEDPSRINDVLADPNRRIPVEFPPPVSFTPPGFIQGFILVP